MASEDYTPHDPNDLETASPFEDLYGWKEEDRQQQEVMKAIADDMRRAGKYDTKIYPPIIGWRERNIVVDGHTRRRAATEAGIEVKVTWMSFADEYEALSFALAQQQNRRNVQMDDAAFRRARRALESARGKREVGRPAKTADEIVFQNTISEQGASPEATDEQVSRLEIAAKLGYRSATKVNEDRLVEKYGSPELNKAVDEGKIKIKPAARKVRAERKAAVSVPPAKSTPVLSRDAPPKAETSATLSIDIADIDRKVHGWLAAHKDAIASELTRMVGPINLARKPPLYGALWDILTIGSPETWPACPKCSGEGVVAGSGTCPKCFGARYRIAI